MNRFFVDQRFALPSCSPLQIRALEIFKLLSDVNGEVTSLIHANFSLNNGILTCTVPRHLKLLRGGEPAAVVSRYDEEEEGGRDARHHAKHPEQDAIDRCGQLAPLDHHCLADVRELLPVDEVAHEALLIGGHVERAVR